MSHNKLRTEKNCLNCGHLVEDRFCTHCGQENIEMHDSTWHMLVHYVQDLFHYDGRTLHTLKTLFKKPGLVAEEYINGKRKSNIEPIKFYIFSSTVFFLLLFTFSKTEDPPSDDPRIDLNKRLYNLQREKLLQKGRSDTLQVNQLIVSVQKSIDSLNDVYGDTIAPPDALIDVGQEFEGDTDTLDWFTRALYKKGRELIEKHQGDENALQHAIWDAVIHSLPQLIFLGLPFFAAFLKLLYFNRRRTYVEHLIFSIYQYAYLFSFLIFFLIATWLVDKADTPVLNFLFGWLSTAAVIYFFVYLFLSMKRFYGGKKRWLLLRYFTLLVLMCFTILVLFAVVSSIKLLFA